MLVQAAAEQHVAMADSWEDIPPELLTAEFPVSALPLDCMSDDCIDLTEDVDVVMAPAAGQSSFALTVPLCHDVSPAAHQSGSCHAGVSYLVHAVVYVLLLRPCFCNLCCCTSSQYW